MADTLLNAASADGDGPNSTVTSNFANVDVSGLNSPSRVQLHLAADGTNFYAMADVIQRNGTHPVDLPGITANTSLLKAEVLGLAGRTGEAITAQITYG